MDEEQIIGTFKQMKAEQSGLVSKLAELEMEANEHGLVINAIEKLEPGRKCFRLVGGVLVERTVGDVLPVVRKNREQLVEVIEKMTQQLNDKAKAINDFATKYKIQTQQRGSQSSEQSGKSSKSSSAGVLV